LKIAPEVSRSWDPGSIQTIPGPRRKKAVLWFPLLLSASILELTFWLDISILRHMAGCLPAGYIWVWGWSELVVHMPVDFAPLMPHWALCLHSTQCHKQRIEYNLW